MVSQQRHAGLRHLISVNVAGLTVRVPEEKGFIMVDTLTIAGTVATEPRHIVTSQGLSITSFRLASAQRKYDRNTNTWSDGETNWYTVTAFRQLAENVVASVKKGERVMVFGKLRIRGWQKDERSGLSVEIDADAVGHDLIWGTSVYTRNTVSAATGGLSAHSGVGSTVENGVREGAESPDMGTAEPNVAVFSPEEDLTPTPF